MSRSPQPCMPPVVFATADSTLGAVAAACSARGVCWLALGDSADALIKELLRNFPQARPQRDARPDHSDPCGAMLARVFAAIEHPERAHGLALDLSGTVFQQSVWAELGRIPAGSAITYAELARRVGRPRAFRAVAQACGANPVGVLVPCHRVIASDGSIGGFGYGLARKRELLRREGLNF